MNFDLQEILKSILAFLSLIWLLISLGKIKMAAYKASIIGLVTSVFVALIIIKMSALSLFQASLEGFMLALFPIIWVIISALFVYNVTVETGNMEVIKQLLSGLSADRRVQTFILALAFGGFLEAVAGFGTVVAIPAVSGTTVKGKLFPSGEKDRYLHIYYNERKRTAEREQLEEKIDRMAAFLENQQGKTKYECPSAFCHYFDPIYHTQGDVKT